MSYFGDMTLGSTINIMFTTVGTSGLPTQLAATTSTTVSIYPNNSTTQLTAGATLTTDFDGITGLNAISVALTGGNGYAVATNYGVVLATGTVGGTNVLGYVVGSFSIQNRDNTLIPNAINSATFSAGAITSTAFTTGAIAATTFVSGAVVATTFAAGAITSTVLAAGALTSTTFTTGSIAATTFIAGSITSTVLAAGAIHSTIFTTGAIAATTFINGAITSSVLAAGAIHSTIFTTGAIVGTTFAGVLPSNFSSMSISVAGLVAITSTIKKNTVATGFMFVMTDMTSHLPAAGLTIVGQRSLDGAAFGALANSAANVGNGTYSINFAAADTNADHIMYRFTNATSDDLNIEIITQP